MCQGKYRFARSRPALVEEWPLLMSSVEKRAEWKPWVGCCHTSVEIIRRFKRYHPELKVLWLTPDRQYTIREAITIDVSRRVAAHCAWKDDTLENQYADSL
jgi:hypothetical protein